MKFGAHQLLKSGLKLGEDVWVVSGDIIVGKQDSLNAGSGTANNRCDFPEISKATICGEEFIIDRVYNSRTCKALLKPTNSDVLALIKP